MADFSLEQKLKNYYQNNVNNMSHRRLKQAIDDYPYIIEYINLPSKNNNINQLIAQYTIKNEDDIAILNNFYKHNSDFAEYLEQKVGNMSSFLSADNAVQNAFSMFKKPLNFIKADRTKEKNNIKINKKNAEILTTVDKILHDVRNFSSSLSKTPVQNSNQYEYHTLKNFLDNYKSTEDIESPQKELEYIKKSCYKLESDLYKYMHMARRHDYSIMGDYINMMEQEYVNMSSDIKKHIKSYIYSMVEQEVEEAQKPLVNSINDIYDNHKNLIKYIYLDNDKFLPQDVVSKIKIEQEQYQKPINQQSDQNTTTTSEPIQQATNNTNTNINKNVDTNSKEYKLSTIMHNPEAFFDLDIEDQNDEDIQKQAIKYSTDNNIILKMKKIDGIKISPENLLLGAQKIHS